MNPTQRPSQMQNGRFTNLRPLTKGGMGALYLANEAIATEMRKVVIKEMLDYFDSNDPQGQEKAQRRFEAEAITLANLSIPGVPQVFAYFSEGGRNYIVMQFIEGKNLESGLSHIDAKGNPYKGKPYPVDQVRRWGIDVCRMLASLAVQNVIHMDIKPANLVVDPSGTVWLVDFGTAKASQGNLARGGAGSAGSRMGSAGGLAGLKKSSVYGTLGYAAPEQIRGKAEPRSDVFALAATLYHLATDDDPGRHPTQFPQLGRLPDDFGDALKRALALDVSRRISAPEFASALEPRSTTRSLGFHWQDGSVSQDPLELAVAADQKWDEARGYFSGTSWENWLQDIHRNDLASRIGEVKKQFKNEDMGLDAFLRILNPKLLPAVLNVPVPYLDAGKLPWGSQRILEVEIQNRGGGALIARVVNPPVCIRGAVDAFAVHRQHTLRLVVDSKMLKPAVTPQTIPVLIDASTAGQVRFLIRLTVPAPQLEIEPDILDWGVADRGKLIDAVLIVRNSGNSGFHCKVSSRMADLRVDPKQFDCQPGEERQVVFWLNTSSYKTGLHRSSISFHAQAGGWEQVEEIQTQVQISLLGTIWNYLGPALAWAIGCGIYGGFIGWFLTGLILGIDGEITTWIEGMFIGGFLGMVVCLFPALVLGMIIKWGEGTFRDRLRAVVDGLRWGAIIGSASGVITGALVGGLAGWIGVSATLFGGFVGGFSAGVLGLLLHELKPKLPGYEDYQG